MEAARNLIQSPPPSLVFHDHVNASFTSMPTASSTRYFPASVFIQEQREECTPLFHPVKEAKLSQGTSNIGLVGTTSFSCKDKLHSNQDMNDLQTQMLSWPGLWYPILVNVSVEKKRMVKSTSMHRKLSKKRRMPIAVEESRLLEKQNTRRERSEVVAQSGPLRRFMSCGETKLLTLKEEHETIEKIQALLKLEELKKMFQDQFAREPTVSEWAAASGLDCRTLKSEIYSGQNSRERLIFANFRMVVHVAKQYQGRGVSLQDLLQEGSLGLMKSVEKFKPQLGCRFATYAYWWIRQAIIKAVSHHSRTIRLPGNVYGLLSKVREANRICVQEGLHQPTKEQVASCAGISVDKLNKLLYSTRLPLSIQQPVWADENTTFQEVTADNSIEIPDLSVSKKVMRQHVCSLLNVLSPKERKIIQLRFGIKEGSQKTLSEIGDVFGLTKERIRQLESRSLHKLKQHLNSHGRGAYAELLF